MKCVVCGNTLEDDEQQCLECVKKENKFQVLTLKERQEFRGITLEQEDQEEQSANNREYENSNANQRIYSRQFSIGNTSFLTKMVFGIIFLSILFVALPVAILTISVVSFIFYIFRR